MVYEFDSNMLPDARFHAGALRYIVPGNEGRLLDPRRTPLRVVDVRLATGAFTVELLAFEDKGARWELPFESVDRCQFAQGCAEASAADVALYADAMARFDRPLTIGADPTQRAATEAHIVSLRADVRTGSGAPLDFASRTGAPALWSDLERYMTAHGLWDMERAFAEQYVRNPHSGELVKGHRIVLAELGLVAFDDKQVRDPDLFAGSWSRERRADHIVRRLAFVREVFARAGHASVVLHRGLSCAGQPETRRNTTFVSATFSLDVATSHFTGRDPASTGVLLRQSVPIERLFMTYLETSAMNQHYKEAEAVLLYDGANTLF